MSNTVPAVPRSARKAAMALIAVSQLLALSLWFSASVVASQLRQVWRLDANQEAGLTLAVQLGFVTGALLSALFNVADIVPTRRLFVTCSALGALANLGLLLVDANSVGAGLIIRFVTGIFLAGVYPAGLKVMAGWFRSGRGMALGVLVGALTVGSASPHLVRGLGLEWEGVVMSSSVLAFLGAAVMARIMDGPHEVRGQSFDWKHVTRVVRNRGVRLSTYGYLGHMWELYAMWTWIAAFIAASAAASGGGYGSESLITFGVIAVGALGSWWAGWLADRVGRPIIAGGAMLASGTCALLTPLIFGGPVWVVVPVLSLWGLTVVADSAQFSAMVTEAAEDQVRGTALTLQTAVGFLLTLVTIRGVPAIAVMVGWRWAFPVLAVGPAFGVAAMVRLSRSSLTERLAGGRA